MFSMLIHELFLTQVLFLEVFDIHLLAYSLNAWKDQGWARLNPDAENTTHVSCRTTGALQKHEVHGFAYN